MMSTPTDDRLTPLQRVQSKIDSLCRVRLGIECFIEKLKTENYCRSLNIPPDRLAIILSDPKEFKNHYFDNISVLKQKKSEENTNRALVLLFNLTTSPQPFSLPWNQKTLLQLSLC
jgi:hypothetical protein